MISIRTSDGLEFHERTPSRGCLRNTQNFVICPGKLGGVSSLLTHAYHYLIAHAHKQGSPCSISEDRTYSIHGVPTTRSCNISHRELAFDSA